MHVAITGSSGLIGTRLAAHLEAAGHRVTRVRRGRTDDSWDPPSGWIGAGAFEYVDAVVHLAGASIGERRWTAARKRELRESRIVATRLLVEHFATFDPPPHVLVSASAVGHYGDRGDQELTEDASPGNGFLAALTEDWEREALLAEPHGIRVVTPRFGVVLAKHGGALPRMLFRCGSDSAARSATAGSGCRGSPCTTRSARWSSCSRTRCAARSTSSRRAPRRTAR